ncbi:MAG: hypothetical protein EOR73_26620 [Mesorhizobium sp.]|nr:MAG: hypothetical protein EOR73_26620 [Mesorhizobium sp.]
MTVCVCVKVNECMVFAADSATSFDGLGEKDGDGVPIQQVYRHGNKLFQLHREFPIMAMTSGLGNFGQASIAMLAKQFRRMIAEGGDLALPGKYTMKEVVAAAHKFFLEEKYSEAFGKIEGFDGGFELWIGGYSAGEMFPELWRLRVFQGKIEEPELRAGTGQVGIYYGGQPDPIQRLINGFGWKLEKILMDNGVTPDSHPDLYKSVAPELYLPLLSPVMPIQDAIDLTEFLADLTKKVFRFRAVPEYVSGDIDVATITPFENFRWIKRKHYYPEHLNREVDHV